MGDSRTWELEALPLDYLIDRVKAAIEANMDIKQTVAGQLRF